MPLTDKQIQNAKPGIKPDQTVTNKLYKISDSNGLYLEVPMKGNKRWRYKFYFEGKEKRLSLGTYPKISLKDARRKRDQMRLMLDDGIDPSYERKSQKLHSSAIGTSYEEVAREWHSRNKNNWTQKYADLTLSRLEQNAFPWLGGRSIDKISAPELLQVIKRTYDRGAIETAHRVRRLSNTIFKFAIANGWTEKNPAAALEGAFPTQKTKHHSALTEPKKVAELLRAIDGYAGHFTTICALKLSCLVMNRPINIRAAEWSDIDLGNDVWRIHEGKMKSSRTHIIPLSKQARAVLQEIYPLTGMGKYVFPCVRSKERPMSENTINAAIRRMGFSSDEMTAHGFRGMASTMLHEQGYNTDWIERQLAHSDSSTRAAYNHAQHLDDRAIMLQEWADYLDHIKSHSV